MLTRFNSCTLVAPLPRHATRCFQNTSDVAGSGRRALLRESEPKRRVPVPQDNLKMASNNPVSGFAQTSC